MPGHVAVGPDLSPVEDVDRLAARAAGQILPESLDRMPPQPGPKGQQRRWPADEPGGGAPWRGTSRWRTSSPRCFGEAVAHSRPVRPAHRQSSHNTTGGANNKPCRRTSMASPQTTPARAKCHVRPPRDAAATANAAATNSSAVSMSRAARWAWPNSRGMTATAAAATVPAHRPSCHAVHAPTRNTSRAKAAAGAKRAPGSRWPAAYPADCRRASASRQEVVAQRPLDRRAAGPPIEIAVDVGRPKKGPPLLPEARRTSSLPINT